MAAADRATGQQGDRLTPAMVKAERMIPRNWLVLGSAQIDRGCASGRYPISGVSAAQQDPPSCEIMHGCQTDLDVGYLGVSATVRPAAEGVDLKAGDGSAEEAVRVNGNLNHTRGHVYSLAPYMRTA